jgi:UDP-glucose 4-epimerase
MTTALTVLTTGGAGFIGSHTCVALLERGHQVVVIDDYSNSSPKSLDHVRDIAGGSLVAHRVDVRDRVGLAKVFGEYDIDVVIHFAAKKSVPESTEIPLEYFDINVAGTITLLQVMHDSGVRRLVYSSSCSIYGEAQRVPLTESDPVGPTNPYAWTKWTGEQIIEQACRYDTGLSATSLRYFNPIGAHPSGLLGEAPTGPVYNVMPFLMQVASGQLAQLSIYGDDYPTPDRTAVRDYIHVVDVAEAHVVALDHFGDAPGMQVLNVGTGVGTSVMQLRDAFARASGHDIPFVIRPRRPGDVAVLIADPRKVENQWDWRTSRDLDDMCRDAWRFRCHNPCGYSD